MDFTLLCKDDCKVLCTLFPMHNVEKLCVPHLSQNNQITRTDWRKCLVQCLNLIAHRMDNLVSVSLNLRFLLGVVTLIQYIYPFFNSTDLQENMEYFGKALQLISVSH